MKDLGGKLVFLLFSISIFQGCSINSPSYDYSASIECLAEPPGPQYGGGLLDNSEFNKSLGGWVSFGHGKVEKRRSESGRYFFVAYDRERPYQSISKKVDLQKELLYTFSAWVQIDEGNASVRAVFRVGYNFITVGTVEAKSGCWSMIKGGLTVNASGPAEFYFESENITAEIWVDSVSLQPFTKDEWRADQAKSIEKVRKTTIRLQVVDAKDNTITGATVSLRQRRPGFPLGCAIAGTILNNTAYQNWFTSRFTVTTFENEMKWYFTEPVQGNVNYSVPDAMVAFANENNIAIRGHNVFWDNPKLQPYWVLSLSPSQLWNKSSMRIDSVMSRYKGQVIAWDVVNENLHFSFFEDELGKNVSDIFYQKAFQLDPDTLMFMNEYNTIEYPGDPKSTLGKYLEKLKEIQTSYPESKNNMAIGLQGHFGIPNIPYMRSALDTFAKANVPIWITEVDVNEGPNQADYLEEVLREFYSHPAVQGIVIWSARHPEGCDVMCLTDNDFKNLPTGDVVDKLLAEWRSGQVVGKTGEDGFFQTQLFQGEYEMNITNPIVNSASVQILTVEPGSPEFFRVTV